MGVIQWAELHPSLSLGIAMTIIGVVVAILAIRDARKRLKGIYEIDDVLLRMFNIALVVAREKANTIKLDDRWGRVMYRIIKDITGVDATKYVGRDMTDRREIAKMGRRVRKLAPTDEDAQPVLQGIVSAMVNNGYGVDEKGLETKNRQYGRLKRRLGILRKVPSNQINDAINRCLDSIYTLSNMYIFYSCRIRTADGLSQQTLADMRNFMRDQENNAGDISKCLTGLRIEIDTFVKGDKAAKGN